MSPAHLSGSASTKPSASSFYGSPRTNRFASVRFFSPPTLRSDALRRFLIRFHAEKARRRLTVERERLDAIKHSLSQQISSDIPSLLLKSEEHLNSSSTVPLGELVTDSPERMPPHRPFKSSKAFSRSQPSLMKQNGVRSLTSIQEEPLHSIMLAAPVPNGEAHPVLENNNVLEQQRLLSMLGSPTNKDVDQDRPIQTKIMFEEQDIVLHQDGSILAGSLRALIKKLIPRKDYCPDQSFIFVCLLNLRAFIAPSDLLHHVLQQCIFEQNSASENFKKESRTRFYANVLRLCKEWVEAFPYDFGADAMMERLKELFGLCASADFSLQQHTKSILHNLSNKLSKLDRYETALTNIKNEASFQLWPSESFTGISTVCNSPVTVAQQLTHIELERLSMIGPEEFVHTLMKDCINTQNGVITKPSKTRNIYHYVDWFNRLTYLTATDVCKHLKKKHRVRAIEFLIDVAKECFNIGNLNSLMAIVAGLNMTTVSRLKNTWSRVDTSKLAILQHQLDPSGNFVTYRSTLKAAIWRAQGAKKETEKIVVPFFSLFVKDITLLHHKCVRRLPNGHLNFSMFSQFADRIQDFLEWKNVFCSFERNSELLQYILTNPCFSDKALQLASFECEAPEQNLEKEQHKRLKFELHWAR